MLKTSGPMILRDLARVIRLWVLSNLSQRPTKRTPGDATHAGRFDVTLRVLSRLSALAQGSAWFTAIHLRGWLKSKTMCRNVLCRTEICFRIV